MSVECIDSFWFGEEPIADLVGRPGFRATRLDLRCPDGLDELLEGCTGIVHLAGLVGDGACAIDPELTRSCNYAATLDVAQRARRLGIERFVFASSCSVYGCVAEQGGGAREDGDTHPLSLYARDKLACEDALAALASDDFHPTSLRLATVFGWSPRMRFDLVANLFAARAVASEQLRVFGGTQWRPLVHVEDVARAFALALETPRELVSGRAFNVGSMDNNIRIVDLAELVSGLVPDGSVVREPGLADPRDYRVDFSRISTELGFEPKYTIAAGVEELVRELEANPVADITAPRYVNEKTTRAIWQDGRQEASCR